MNARKPETMTRREVVDGIRKKLDTYKPHRPQSHVLAREKMSPAWNVLKVRTFEAWNPSLLASVTTVRVTDDAGFVDVAVEEYTGESRRAKLCNVRLEEPAARALYEQLKELYS